MSVEWVQGMSPEAKAEFTQVWKNSTYVFDPLKEIINRYLNDLEVEPESVYTNPNWAYLRADRNGQIRQLKNILRLLP